MKWRARDRTPLATEIISVAREGEERERERRKERERGELLSRPRKGRGEARASPPDSPCDGILFRRQRETFAEEERKKKKKKRGEKAKEGEREGREEDFPPPTSLATKAISVARRREER